MHRICHKDSIFGLFTEYRYRNNAKMVRTGRNGGSELSGNCHYWKWWLIWQMQTTCRFFYGTNWSPAANSGQRGPWSYRTSKSMAFTLYDWNLAKILSFPILIIILQSGHKSYNHFSALSNMWLDKIWVLSSLTFGELGPVAAGFQWSTTAGCLV